MECAKCRGYAGWVCEQHPDKPFMHDGCIGPGMPCEEPGCEHSLFGTTPETPGVGERMLAGVAARGGRVVCSVYGAPQLSQYYVGIKQVFAWPEQKHGKPGYAVVYRHGQPDEYRSWSPKEEFERLYLPQGADPTRVTQAMVDGFVADGTHPTTVNGKMTVLNVELKNGTVFAESSACVEPANYDEKIGAKICLDRVKDRVRHLLGFALQWARNGLK